jgi:2Fe-2S ferredoxin
MPQLTIITRDGEERTVRARSGWTVMEAIRDNDIDELRALCGGSTSCATCHVHVDEAWLRHLPELTDDEDYLLDGSDHRTVRSRLSCQITMADNLDGLRVVIAPDD